MGTEKIIVNKMLVPGTDKRLYSINLHMGGLINGVVPDGRSVITRAREESTQYESMFGIKIPANVMADRMALKFQMNTIYSAYRPYGTSLVMGAHDSMNGF